MKIIETDLLPEFVQVKVRQRKWAHRVMYQRYREYDYEDRRHVMRCGDLWYMHPNTAKALREQINARIQA